MEVFIDELGLKVLYGMMNAKDSINSLSNTIFQSMIRSYGVDRLIPGFINNLELASSVKVKIGGLGVLNELVQKSFVYLVFLFTFQLLARHP